MDCDEQDALARRQPRKGGAEHRSALQIERTIRLLMNVPARFAFSGLDWQAAEILNWQNIAGGVAGFPRDVPRRLVSGDEKFDSLA
jgi:hypothetical protein